MGMAGGNPALDAAFEAFAEKNDAVIGLGWLDDEGC
jgi:hypothetical protein